MQEVFEKIIEKLRASEYNHAVCGKDMAIDTETAVQIVEDACEEYNNGWIPCSERLPTMHECQENDCRFIVTDGNRRYQAWFNIYDGFFEIPRNRDDIMREDKCVIAWQPLPSVWKGENNG